MGGVRRPGDHPRSRGVYTGRSTTTTRAAGSSPLARGLRISAKNSDTFFGIIPARAGFTVLRRPRPRPSRDHPRSRGVYLPQVPQAPAVAGSSPLARGLLHDPDGPCVADGIIPARAGFTRTAGTCTWIRADHPRSRGVYPPVKGHGPESDGSSPLARGLRQGVAQDDLAPGIIPARAGFTRRSAPASMRRPDHPRSRGVYSHRGHSGP